MSAYARIVITIFNFVICGLLYRLIVKIHLRCDRPDEFSSGVDIIQSPKDAKFQ
jgi:hypothetical protein